MAPTTSARGIARSCKWAVNAWYLCSLGQTRREGAREKRCMQLELGSVTGNRQDLRRAGATSVRVEWLASSNALRPLGQSYRDGSVVRMPHPSTPNSRRPARIWGALAEDLRPRVGLERLQSERTCETMLHVLG